MQPSLELSIVILEFSLKPVTHLANFDMCTQATSMSHDCDRDCNMDLDVRDVMSGGNVCLRIDSEHCVE